MVMRVILLVGIVSIMGAVGSVLYPAYECSKRGGTMAQTWRLSTAMSTGESVVVRRTECVDASQ